MKKSILLFFCIIIVTGVVNAQAQQGNVPPVKSGNDHIASVKQTVSLPIKSGGVTTGQQRSVAAAQSLPLRTTDGGGATGKTAGKTIQSVTPAAQSGSGNNKPATPSATPVRQKKDSLQNTTGQILRQ